MRSVVLLVVLLAGCGKEIGDACIVSSDCDPNGQRICDSSQREGYCTIQGCDYDTCPSEAACIRFFTGQFDNRTCDPTQPSGTNGCSLDELCALSGHCAPRSSELRYCMKKCSSDGDCRDGYECRKYSQKDPANMATYVAHGGEPVLAPGVVVGDSSPGFCAAKPAS
jgi:hypothetical protein